MTLARFRLRWRGDELEVAREVVVGRSASCEVRVEDALVSRRHARFAMVADGLMVEDLGSRNGVLVNERKIAQPTLLAHGDVVGIGLQILEVVDTEVVARDETLDTMPPPAFVESDVDAPPITQVATLDVLSEREREVLRLVVLGHTQKEIAARLHLSVKTVESHRTNVARKLDCKTRAELVAYAISAGLLRHA